MWMSSHRLGAPASKPSLFTVLRSQHIAIWPLFIKHAYARIWVYAHVGTDQAGPNACSFQICADFFSVAFLHLDLRLNIPRLNIQSAADCRLYLHNPERPPLRCSASPWCVVPNKNQPALKTAVTGVN